MSSQPQNIGKYRIEKTLGAGAMGIVYQGFDNVLERRVAIKTIRSEYLACGSNHSDYLIRLKREAQAAGRLNHPNIAIIHEFGIDDETRPFIVMEYVAGRDLKELLQQEPGKPGLIFTFEIVTQVLEALNYAHRQGVVHRDIKPSNLLIKADNSVTITDFGIAHIDTSDLTIDGSIMGTPNYMAPEQLLGQDIDQRADIFSVGVVLYEMVTGEKPYPGRGAAGKITSMLKEPLIKAGSLNLHLPPELDPIINKALAIDKDERYQSAAEFLDELKKVISIPLPAYDTCDNEELTIMTLGSNPEIEKKEVNNTSDETVFTSTSDETIYEKPKRKNLASSKTPKAEAPGLPPYRFLKTGVALFIVLVLAAVALSSRFLLFPTARNRSLQETKINRHSTKEIPAEEKNNTLDTLPGKIRISSVPQGSAVLLKGKIQGETPCLINLPPGDHDLVLQLPGYEQMAIMVSVLTNQEIDFTVNFKAQ
ncbi:serine/threonine protein kinase [bacterium]|nr:serine/threonine protein kinase [bacterium]